MFVRVSLIHRYNSTSLFTERILATFGTIVLLFIQSHDTELAPAVLLQRLLQCKSTNACLSFVTVTITQSPAAATRTHKARLPATVVSGIYL